MAQQQHSPSLPDLAGAYRELYRGKVRADLQAGTSTPFVLPLHLLAYWIIPTLYLAIPHKNRPWLYSARWLILAGTLAFHWQMVNNVASLNFAAGYGVGLMSAWATIWNFTLLVWTKPQWDAKRVERRRVIRRIDRVEGSSKCSDRLSKSPSRNDSLPQDSKPAIGEPDGHTLALPGDNCVVPKSKVNGSADANTITGSLRPNENGDIQAAKRGEILTAPPAILKSMDEDNKENPLKKNIASPSDSHEDLQLDEKITPELYRLAREQEYEYFWQEFPADASFWTRLNWAFDIVASFRLTGWNWAPSCLPPYELPPSVGPYQLPLEYGSHRSKQGHERTLSRPKLVFSRIFFNIIPSYIIVDLCATLMTCDPYFVVGPEYNHPLPAPLASLHPILLSLVRTLSCFVGIVSALILTWNFGAVLLALYGPPILGFRAHPWHLPSMEGSFTQILDYGLNGFWGSWWHQTFRVGFLAPTKWLIRHGYLPAPRQSGDGGNSKTVFLSTAVGAIIAFAQSGFIHAAGSYSSAPPTRCWGPPLFFALSGVGTMLQSALSHLLRRHITKLPRWVRRLGNFVFVFLWLWATSWLFLDDLSRSGVWLWEPVPVSLARALGLGGADKRVWRYDADFLPRWQWGARGRWWETGIKL
ncbi:hypothetical protein GGS21DRAFT_526966 [Xylaria nigripes]|nr:hypothetical protein GGS21DRAFT_526966 [Xylaria nigripes]